MVALSTPVNNRSRDRSQTKTVVRSPWLLFYLALAADEERLFGRRQLGAVVTARKQVAVSVGRHLDGGMSEPRLHDLERQLKPAVDAAVDAPGRIEMAQAVQAGILGAATCR